MNILIDLNQYPVVNVLDVLLKDKTTNENIIFATDSYTSFGADYSEESQITADKLRGFDTCEIQPRVFKSLEAQKLRTRVKAEVMTPGWIVCKMNAYADEEWFGRPNVFETLEGESWMPFEGHIEFPEGKSWQEYVDSRRIEITCGEAPYIVSRYDVTTGEIIPLNRRIGLLDRKMRIVNENTSTEEEWHKWALRAFQSVYGYEWQGDNLLLARETLLITFCDYFEAFAKEKNLDSKELSPSCLLHAAYIISWNLFQMDGLKMVLPLTCKDTVSKETLSFYEEPKEKVTPCPGCDKQNVHKHNGIKQIVADWQKDSWSIDERPISVVEFHSLMP